jgi:hypothetical protein
MKMHFSVMAVVAAMWLILASGCASSPEQSSSPPPAAASGAIAIKQPPMTSYMQSQVGTPNELSPMAPPEARNVRKVGDHWMCEINGRSMIFNDAGACWEPHNQ